MRNFLFATLIALTAIVSFPKTSFAESFQNLTNKQFVLDRGSILRENRVGRSIYKQRVHDFVCRYSFAVQGGATTAAINLQDEDGQACVLPKNGIVTTVFMDITTTFTSGGSATIAIGTGQAANDVKTATAVASWTSGLLVAVPIGTAATAIKLTADQKPTLTVATAALTAGKANFHFLTLVSE